MGKKSGIGLLIIGGIILFLIFRNKFASAQTLPQTTVIPIGRLPGFEEAKAEANRTNVVEGRPGSSILRTFLQNGKRFFETEQGVFEDKLNRTFGAF